MYILRHGNGDKEKWGYYAGDPKASATSLSTQSTDATILQGLTGTLRAARLGLFTWSMIDWERNADISEGLTTLARNMR